MTPRPDFKKTQEISTDIAGQIAQMGSLSAVNLILNVIIPFDENNPLHRGAPIIVRDGASYIDTAKLKQQMRDALETHNPELVPDVLNLRQAAHNILTKTPLITEAIRPRETVPDIDANAVREALRTPAPPNNPQSEPRKNDFAKTVPYAPVKKS